MSGQEDNLISVFRTDDCSDRLRLLTDRYANRISDAQFRSAHPELFPNIDIDSDVRCRIGHKQQCIISRTIIFWCTALHGLII